MYGMEHRVPKDVDLLVLNANQGHMGEDIKRMVATTDSNFSLLASRVVGANHNVLWYNLPPPQRVETRSRKHKPSQKPEGGTAALRKVCKVDILVPGALDIPHIPKSQLHFDTSSTFVSYSEDKESSSPQILPIACVPFSTLLMLKLRAWADHSLPNATHVMHQKIPQDEEDIEELLRISITLGSQGVIRVGSAFSVKSDGSESENAWTLGGFSSWWEAKRCVMVYVKKWPRSATGWRDVGFC
jgi:hypothetical protein